MDDKPFSDDEVRLAALRILSDRRVYTLDALRKQINKKRKKGTAEATPAQMLDAASKLASRRDVTFDGDQIHLGAKR